MGDLEVLTAPATCGPLKVSCEDGLPKGGRTLCIHTPGYVPGLSVFAIRARGDFYRENRHLDLRQGVLVRLLRGLHLIRLTGFVVLDVLLEPIVEGVAL